MWFATMDEDAGNLKLIEKARLGYREDVGELARIAEPRVFAYIYRLTLNDDLARDLTQETLLKMVESVKDLKRPDRFWSWLFRTALGGVQHHFRDRREQALHISQMSGERLSKLLSADRNDGLSAAMRNELSEAVCQAIARLRLAYRNVLVLRCFEQLSFAQVAEAMQCKPLHARVLLYRARRSLARQLCQRGFSKTLLLTALGLFGVITAPTEAASTASTVTAASLDVGPLAVLVAAATGKLIIPAAGAIAAVAVGVTLENLLVGCAVFAFVFISFVIALCVD